MKVAYIAHPISGDVEKNIEKILDIIRHTNLTHPGIIPFAPYIPDCICMDDSIPAERERGIANDVGLFHKGFIDELWLCGDRISYGMEAEKRLAEQLGIPVINMITKKA
jgi:hypothetical protein